MAHWTLDDIPWEQFDRSKVTPDMVSLIKAASLVEFNGNDYARYLCNVFADDTQFKDAIMQWASEEIKHGLALAKWAQLADPQFDFQGSFKSFTEGYQLPLDAQQSVRGSRAGELIARCAVETGTSSYYTAIRRTAEEPVLQAICAKIAADEFRHYKLFYDTLKRYLDIEKLGRARRFLVAMSRVAESEDDELAYAYYAAHGSQGLYDRKTYTRLYLRKASSVYRREDIRRMSGMLLKAAGLKPNGWLDRLLSTLAWHLLRIRIQAMRAQN